MERCKYSCSDCKYFDFEYGLTGFGDCTTWCTHENDHYDDVGWNMPPCGDFCRKED